MNPTKANKYFLYARKSSESEDRQVASIPSQIDELNVIAQREGLNVIKVFKEEKSAKAPGRPVFNEMISRISAGEAQGIVCWKLDRLARNPVDAGTITWLLQTSLIGHIQTYERSYYPSDNVLLMNVEFGVANQFVRDLSVNTKRGIRRKVSEGWFPSKPPIGYLNNRRIDKRNNSYEHPNKPPIFTDEERFHIMKKLWTLLLEKKHSMRQMKEIADDLGLRTPRGKKLALSKIHYLFTNPFYCGEFRHKGEIYKGNHNPMISKADFEKAQQIISGRYKSRPKYRKFAFTGLIRCGECGSGITAEHKSKVQKNGNYHEWIYYRCTKSIDPKCAQKPIRQEMLDGQVIEALEKVTIPPEFHQWAIKYLKEEQIKEIEDRDKIAASQQNALNACRKKLDALFSLRIDNEITADEFKNRKQDFLTEQRRSEELIADTTHRVETWLDRAEQVLDFAETARERFENGDIETKKGILQCLGSNLTLQDRILKVELKPPLGMVSEIAVEVQTLHSTLEPTQSYTTQQHLEVIYSQNKKWGE